MQQKHSSEKNLPSGRGVPAMMHLRTTSTPVDAAKSWSGNSNTGASMGSSPADTYESSEDSARVFREQENISHHALYLGSVIKAILIYTTLNTFKKR